MSADGIPFDPKFPYWLSPEDRADDLSIDQILKKHDRNVSSTVPEQGGDFQFYVDGFRKLLGKKSAYQYRQCEHLREVSSNGRATGQQFWDYIWVRSGLEKQDDPDRFIKDKSRWLRRCDSLHELASEEFKNVDIPPPVPVPVIPSPPKITTKPIRFEPI